MNAGASAFKSAIQMAGAGMTGTIGLTTADGIARLVISQPEKLNAISLPMWLSLPAFIARAVADPAVRLIVLAGEGRKAFSAGADISRFGGERQGAAAVKAYDAAVAQAETALVNASKPTIALIEGICFGGGVGLACACDIRLANASARFRVPAAKLGIGYAPRGLARLAQLVGPSHCAEIFFSARTYAAAQAQAMGLVNQVWADAAFEDNAADYLANMAQNAPLSLQAAKLALLELGIPEAARNFAAAEAMVAGCYESQDYAEGQAAFAEKRAPVFTGR